MSCPEAIHQLDRVSDGIQSTVMEIPDGSDRAAIHTV